MTRLAVAIAFLVCSGLPAVADKGAAASCRAYAESVAYTGERFGYAERYEAAYAACLGQTVQVRGHIDYNNRTTIRSPIAAHCPPGAPKMYRGTLYCVN
jgi:hypothetical protein